MCCERGLGCAHRWARIAGLALKCLLAAPVRHHSSRRMPQCCRGLLANYHAFFARDGIHPEREALRCPWMQRSEWVQPIVAVACGLVEVMLQYVTDLDEPESAVLTSETACAIDPTSNSCDMSMWWPSLRQDTSLLPAEYPCLLLPSGRSVRCCLKWVMYCWHAHHMGNASNTTRNYLEPLMRELLHRELPLIELCAGVDPVMRNARRCP